LEARALREPAGTFWRPCSRIGDQYARSLHIYGKTISVHIPTADDYTPTHKPTKVPVYRPVSSEHRHPPEIPVPGDFEGFALDNRFGFFSPDGPQVLEDTL
jgi:hypothetical protein